MIPTITDLNSNDNEAVLSASKDAEQISVLYRKLANDQRNIEKAYEKTLSRIMSRTNAHQDTMGKILDAENSNSKESYIRPRAPGAQPSVNKTMDRILARHNMPEEEGYHLFSWENDNNKDFYTLARRDPTDNDHDETISRILAKQSVQNDVEPAQEHDAEVSSLPAPDFSESRDTVMKTIENTTTNILDVLKQIFHSVNDITQGLDVASQKARERDIESGHGLGHIDPDSLSDALSRALKDRDSDKDNKSKKEDSTITKIAKIAKGLTLPAIVGSAGAAISSLTTHSAHTEGGFDGSQQSPSAKASYRNRTGGEAPVIQGPPPLVGQKSAEQNAALLAATLRARGFNNKEIANMLAQAEDESNFRPRSENISYSQAEKMYLHNRYLGNQQQGDGYKYRGRGLIQLTGRANYEHMSRVLGMGDALVRNPDLANDPNIASKIAAEYFVEKKKMLHLKNYNDITSATRAIAPANFAKENADRARLASKYSDAVVNDLAAQGRGQMLNVASSQSNAKPNVVVVNNTNNVSQNGAVKQPSGPTKPAIPPSRSSFWDGWSKYFSL
jgi:predicted chitinase